MAAASQEQKKKFNWLWPVGIIAVGSLSYAALNQEAPVENAPNENNPAPGITATEAPTAEVETDVIVIPTRSNQTVEQADLMDLSLNTSPGLGSWENTIAITDAATTQATLEQIWATYESATGEELTEAQAQFIWEQILTGEVTYGSRGILAVENLGLGFTPEIVAHFDDMEREVNQLFTNQSLNQMDSEFAISYLQFRNNPAENSQTGDLFLTQENNAYGYYVYDSFDNTYEVAFAHALGLLHKIEVDGESLWSQYTPEQRINFAMQLTQGWMSQRIDGSVNWGQRPIQYTEDGDVFSLTSVNSGENGFVACRVQADDNSQERIESNLTLQRVLIREQDNETNNETPWSELSRNGSFAVVINVDLEQTNEIAANGGNIVWSILNETGAFEIIDFSTNFNGANASDESEEIRNVIQGNYEVAGLSFEEVPFEESDDIFMIRPCGQGTPIQEVQPQIEETPIVPQETPTDNPTCEEINGAGNCGETEVKDDAGNETNPDGETNEDPEGGEVIIDGEVDTDGDGEGDIPDNVGSGR